MTGPVRDGKAMLAGMNPGRVPGEWVFVTVPEAARAARLAALARASFAEAEGLSLILPAQVAAAEGFDTALPMAQITLNVWSALDGVGLTAAVAQALERAGIPANIVAAHRHDHVFVPAAMADRALAALADAARAEPPPPILAAGQAWSAKGYADNAGFVPLLGADVLALLDPQPGEAILDLGCGDGVLTGRLVEAGARVTGLEPDPDMADAAIRRGLTVLRQDAHDPFGEGTCDAVFSNAALHWMRDPFRVLSNVFRALRPGGRLVAEQGGFGNVAALVTALNGARAARGLGACVPWDFPSVTRQRQRLRAVGFVVESIALVPRPTPLPTHVAGWLATFAGPFLRDVPPEGHAGLLRDAEVRLAALFDPAEGWMADYVRLRFAARKPG